MRHLPAKPIKKMRSRSGFTAWFSLNERVTGGLLLLAILLSWPAWPARTAMDGESAPSGVYGTVNAGFALDEDDRHDVSSLDVLAPLLEGPDSLIFAQFGGRNQDSRNTVNLGAGGRLFIHRWMLGLNAFFDNDATGKNRRLTLGSEIRTDYINLSANIYYRLTDERQSRDFSALDERPATGYDMRGEAYLPALPQLGAKMVFEQYFGEGVALFDKNIRLDSTRALTVGLSFTPIPLLTLAAEERAGSGDQSDSRISLRIIYRLGLPWREQIDPQAVARMRLLDVSRYDAVDHENLMVLNYLRPR
ncbi:inverse autotransporter beta domain-containing protein [Martelella alba]|uniref:Inverse autotransporter beta-domain domain-containing protein n=1 Tax=Martelella alba TaxID=2590451 RepID=A0ABY2SLH9_9HYPH|nr:inverse autotransporter beta domain-containing protein [Martelella alba]TKI06300.1 hypothetical protein FCN80_10690 [Martelella alba]